MAITRVVLVEDHDLTRIGLQTVLQQEGANVDVIGEARNGIEGLKLLQTVQPDVAIIDIGLPHISGIELTRRFREYQASQETAVQPGTKILMLTMQDNQNSVLAAFAAGADSYCMKTASSEYLIEAIQVTSEGHSWIDPSIARLVLQQVQKRQPPKQNSIDQNYRSDVNSEGSDRVSIQGIDSDQERLLSADPLTERELEILQLIVQGGSNAAISEQLYITVGTVKTHVRNILNKLSADDRTQAAVLALRSGLAS
jgi:DNA-binding NarL/FixJ family response regulator